jgi:hypothetical protein
LAKNEEADAVAAAEEVAKEVVEAAAATEVIVKESV